MGTDGLLELLPSASVTSGRVMPLRDDDSRRVELIRKLAAKHKNAPKKAKTRPFHHINSSTRGPATHLD